MDFAIWIDDVELVRIEGGTVLVRLKSGNGQITLRCSRNFALKGLETIRRELAKQGDGSIVSFV